MNFYSFHIGDYATHTAHLEPMEDLAYRRMLDLYYRTEKPLPRELADIARLIRLKGHEDAIAVVIDEFFEDCADGWMHVRCDAEIQKMQDKQAKAKASAQASVNARSTSAQRTLNERSTPAQRTQSEGSATNTNTNTNTTIAPKEHRARGTRLPEDWEPMNDGREFALTHGIAGAAFNDEAAKFVDYWRAQPGQKGVKTDWPATWRNWVRNAAQRKAPLAAPINRQEAQEQRNRAVGDEWLREQEAADASR